MPAAHGRAPRAALSRSSSRSASPSAPRARTRGPLEGAADHRHAALPPERRAAPVRRLAQQHLRPPRPRRRSAAPTARSRSERLRNFLPELLALSASSPFVEGVNTGLHSARTQIFTRLFPRCGVPDAFAAWAEYERFVRFLYDTGSITEHTQIWWSVRPAPRLSDGRDPDLRRAAGARRGAGRSRRSLRARGPRRARATTRASRCRAASAPADRGEPLARDPLRPLRRAPRPRTRRARSRRGRGSRSWSSGSLPVGRGARRGAVPRRARRERRRAADRPLRGGRDARARSTRSRCARRSASVAEEPDAGSDRRRPRRSCARRSSRVDASPTSS